MYIRPEIGWFSYPFWGIKCILLPSIWKGTMKNIRSKNKRWLRQLWKMSENTNYNWMYSPQKSSLGISPFILFNVTNAPNEENIKRTFSLATRPENNMLQFWNRSKLQSFFDYGFIEQPNWCYNCMAFSQFFPLENKTQMHLKIWQKK